MGANSSEVGPLVIEYLTQWCLADALKYIECICIVMSAVVPGMVYGVADMTACMNQMNIYQQQQQFGS